jgi:hypothetical protein
MERHSARCNLRRYVVSRRNSSGEEGPGNRRFHPHEGKSSGGARLIPSCRSSAFSPRAAEKKMCNYFTIESNCDRESQLIVSCLSIELLSVGGREKENVHRKFFCNCVYFGIILGASMMAHSYREPCIGNCFPLSR